MRVISSQTAVAILKNAKSDDSPKTKSSIVARESNKTTADTKKKDQVDISKEAEKLSDKLDQDKGKEAKTDAKTSDADVKKKEEVAESKPKDDPKVKEEPKAKDEPKVSDEPKAKDEPAPHEDEEVQVDAKKPDDEAAKVKKEGNSSIQFKENSNTDGGGELVVDGGVDATGGPSLPPVSGTDDSSEPPIVEEGGFNDVGDQGGGVSGGGGAISPPENPTADVESGVSREGTTQGLVDYVLRGSSDSGNSPSVKLDAQNQARLDSILKRFDRITAAFEKVITKLANSEDNSANDAVSSSKQVQRLANLGNRLVNRLESVDKTLAGGFTNKLKGLTNRATKLLQSKVNQSYGNFGGKNTQTGQRLASLLNLSA